MAPVDSSSTARAAGTPARRVLALVVVAVLAGGACSRVPGVYVVERKGDRAPAGATGPFDATAYVDGIWADKVLPTLEREGHDAAEVLGALATDADGADGAGATFGRQAGAGSPFTFSVSGRGTVVAVDTASAVGTISVDLAPGDGTADVRLAVGPAILGTAVRDALPFVDFSQFTNQLDYADVATALNARVKSTVLAGIDLAGAQGRTVTFLGAFAAAAPADIIVVPVRLELAP